MIFIQCKLEDLIQVGDKTRLDASDSFKSPDEAAIALIEIEPEASAGFIDVTSTKYLDWQYESDGEKVVTVRVTTDGLPQDKTFIITSISEADDRLFSNDKDISKLEVDVFRFLRPGRASFLDMHRESQTIIIDDLNQRGITDREGNRLTKDDLFDVKEVREWSKYQTLSLIYKSVQSEVDDVYASKALMYEEMAKTQQTRAYIRLDFNQDGTVDNKLNLITGDLTRR
jgi:hypothetical protein